MGRTLPTGTVTFWFSDIVGSTLLAQSLGDDAFADAVLQHRRVIRDECARFDGVEIDTQGDSFFFAFSSAPKAVAAAVASVVGLADGPVRVRLGLHSGEPLVVDDNYVGYDVHRAARIAAAGHGGQILVSAATVALVRPDQLPDGVVFTDLGDHRFKDLGAPERVYQVGTQEFPPIRSLHQTRLPVPATPFLGRSAELDALVDQLSGDSMRLVTLTGPGGVGKTRLALQAAAQVADSYPAGTWWVPLAPVRDPQLVVAAFAQGLEIGEEPGVDLLATMRRALADQRRLIVVDNIEHLLPTAADVAADLVSVAGPAWLITSRQPIAVPGERVHPVGPVDLADARELFADVARRRNPSWQETPESVQLCERLDGLPLAIELAAARSRVLSPRQMLDRIGQRLDLLKGSSAADPRQATLRSTIEWSYQLLTPDEQLAFARLSVFAGGFTLELAEDVADVDLDVVESLLDKSLITRGGDESADPRFTMLESVRAFATEQLNVLPDDPTRRHLVTYFADIMRRRSAVRESMQRSEGPFAEYENVMQALDLAVTHEWSDDAAAIARQLNYFAFRGALTLADARRLMLDANRLPYLDDQSRAWLLRALTANAGNANRLDDLLIFARDSVVAARTFDDPAELVASLATSGYHLYLRGEVELGLEPLAESVAITRAEHLDDYTPVLTYAIALARAGRRDEAREILTEWLDRVSGAMDFLIVANVYAEMDDGAATIDVLARSVAESDEQGWVDVPMYALWVLCLYGWAAEQLNAPEPAARAFACAETSPLLAQFPLDDVEQARIAVAWERIRQTVDADDLSALVAEAQTRDPLELARELLPAHATRR